MGRIEKQFSVLGIPCVGGTIVVPKRSGLCRKDERRRMGCAPFRPGRMLQKDGCEPLAGQRACHGMHADLRPQAFRLVVVHEEVALIEQAGHAKRVSLFVNGRFERDAGATERAVGDDDSRTADRIVDDLMPIENLDRVRLGLCPQCESQNAIGVLEKRGFPG